ncbi:MAG: hypothetical protein M3O98_00905 [Actinomycetota bacterium]|nr:hypothetical protein [Actinomycetota bacterium]
MAVTADQMLGMSKRQLDELFGSHAAGEIPQGEARGTVIIRMGRWLSVLVSRIAHRIAWQGKVFDPVRGELRNEISPLRAKAIRAKVYKAPSWFDQKECIVLDYSRTSFVARKIRDEIREVSPGVFLGIVYWGRAKLINFALTFPPP